MDLIEEVKTKIKRNIWNIKSKHYYRNNRELVLAKKRWEIPKKKSTEFKYINWHKIITLGFWITTSECWTCWDINFRPVHVLEEYKGCKNCSNKKRTPWYAWKSIKYWAWVLDKKVNTIHIRISKWYSVKDAIFLDKIQPVKEFTDKDLIYISDDMQKNHRENKLHEDRAYLKYKMKNLK